MTTNLELLQDYCNSGLVTNKKKDKNHDIWLKFKGLEMSDLYSVASGKKPLAALDFSENGISKIIKRDKELVNQIIDFSNKKGVKAIHIKKECRFYLKTIFYLEENYQKALNLMGILWYENKDCKSLIDYHVMTGLSLGYDEDNIQYFIKKNCNYDIDMSKINEIKNKLKVMKVTLEDLNQIHNIVVLDTIKNI
jgi:hypothetical protein